MANSTPTPIMSVMSHYPDCMAMRLGPLSRRAGVRPLVTSGVEHVRPAGVVGIGRRTDYCGRTPDGQRGAELILGHGIGAL